MTGLNSRRNSNINNNDNSHQQQQDEQTNDVSNTSQRSQHQYVQSAQGRQQQQPYLPLLFATNQQPQLQPQIVQSPMNFHTTATSIPHLNPIQGFNNTTNTPSVFGLTAIPQQHQHQQLLLQALQLQQRQQNALLNTAMNPQPTFQLPMNMNSSYLNNSIAATAQYPQQQRIPFATTNTSATPTAPRIPLTVQDRPLIPPTYNGINTSYPGLRLLNVQPPVYTVDHFLTPSECEFLIAAASDSFTPAPVVGSGVGEISKSRTSSTCYLAREDLPILLQKVYALTGKPWKHTELPQVGRYFANQQYLQHYDTFDLTNEDGQRSALNGGQRVVTVLVYLNDVLRGGQTNFPTLNITVQPKKGMALIFFPSTVDGLLDKNALHAAMPAIDIKYVSQIWLRQGNYEGFPSKRLNRLMV